MGKGAALLLAAGLAAVTAVAGAAPDDPIRAAADRALSRAFPPSSGEWRWELMGPAPALPADLAGSTAQADPVDPTPRSLVSLTVRLARDGRHLRTVLLSYRLHRAATVWVLRKSVAAGTPVSAEDLTPERREISPTENPLSPEKVPDHWWTRRAPAGSPLTAAAVAPRPLVKNGETVSVTVSAGSLRLSAAGRALRDGRAGEAIPVWLSSTRRPVTATVRGPGQLDWTAPGTAQ